MMSTSLSFFMPAAAAAVVAAALPAAAVAAASWRFPSLVMRTHGRVASLRYGAAVFGRVG